MLFIISNSEAFLLFCRIRKATDNQTGAPRISGHYNTNRRKQTLNFIYLQAVFFSPGVLPVPRSHRVLMRLPTFLLCLQRLSALMYCTGIYPRIPSGIPLLLQVIATSTNCHQLHF